MKKKLNNAKIEVIRVATLVDFIIRPGKYW